MDQGNKAALGPLPRLVDVGASDVADARARRALSAEAAETFEASEEDEWEDPEPVLGPYDRAVRAVDDYTDDGERVGADGALGADEAAGLSDDIAACRDEQARNEVAVAAKAAGMSPAEWFSAALRAPVQMLQGEPVVRRPWGDSAVDRGSAMHAGVERLLRRETGTVARLSEPEVHPTAEVYPPAGYTGLSPGQAAALRSVWNGAHLQRNGSEGMVESEDGHVFKLSDAANAHMKIVGAVYTACRWAAGQAPPFPTPAGGQPRDWTPGARFRFSPSPLGEAGEEVGVTLICVVPGPDIHRAQVIFRMDNAPTPRALLIGLWKLATRPEGA